MTTAMLRLNLALYLLLLVLLAATVNAQSPAQQSLLKTGVVASKCDELSNCWLIELNNNFGSSITLNAIMNCDGTSNVTKTVDLSIFERRVIPICPIDGTPIGNRICQFVVTGVSPNTAVTTEFSNFQDSCQPIDLNTYKAKVCGTGDVDDDDGISLCGGDPICHLANGTGDHNCFLMLMIFVPEIIVCFIIYSIGFKAPQDSVEENVVRKASKQQDLYEKMITAMKAKKAKADAKREVINTVQNALGVGNNNNSNAKLAEGSTGVGLNGGGGGGGGGASSSQGSGHATSPTLTGNDILTGVNIVPNGDGVTIDGGGGGGPVLQPTGVNVHHFVHSSNKLIRKRNKNNNTNTNTEQEPLVTTAQSQPAKSDNKKTKSGTTKRNKKQPSPPPTPPQPAPVQYEESAYGDNDDDEYDNQSVADTESRVSSEDTSRFSYDPSDVISMDHNNNEELQQENSYNRSLLSRNPTAPVFYLPRSN